MTATNLVRLPEKLKGPILERKISAFVIALLVFGLLGFASFYLPPYSQLDSYWGSFRDKHARLESISSPKIVLIGGSNLAFGIDSPIIERAMDMPVVNMGLSANLGLRFMLQEVRESLNPGDIIIISPEHQLFFGLKDGCKDIFRVVEACPEASRVLFEGYVLKPENMSMLVINFKQLISAKSKLWFKCLTAQTNVSALFLDEGHRSDFNCYGDCHSHKNKKSTLFDDQEILSSLDLSSIALLNEFCESMRSRGVKVFLVPPCTADSSFVTSKAAVDALYANLRRFLKIPIASVPEKYVVGRSQCFDSPYHLVFDAREERSRHIIDDIGRSKLLTGSNLGISQNPIQPIKSK